MSIEAMKQALEALEKITTVAAMNYEYQRWARETLPALRQAIKKAEKQEQCLTCETLRYEIDALEAKIAELREQAEKQEPVGEMIESAIYEGLIVLCVEGDYPIGTKLYTSPPPRQPLTDEEIERIEAICIEPVDGTGWGFINRNQFARAIEAAHGIKEKA